MNKCTIILAVVLLSSCISAPGDSELDHTSAQLAVMSHTIKRYEIASAGQDLELPTESRILAAKSWKGSIYVWAHVSTENPDVEIHTVSVYQTGDAAPQLPGRFVDSVLLKRKVHHVFVIEPAP